MASKGSLISAFVLRLLTLALLAASVAVMVTNKLATLSDGSKATFKDVTTYRYVVATSVVGCLYLIFQLPFALYMACMGKRLIRNDCFSQFDFLADKLIAFLLATGAAAGFAVTTEFKKSLKDSFISEDYQSKEDKFFDKFNVGSLFLFFAAICMALVSVFSSIHRTWKSNGFFNR